MWNINKWCLLSSYLWAGKVVMYCLRVQNEQKWFMDYLSMIESFTIPSNHSFPLYTNVFLGVQSETTVITIGSAWSICLVILSDVPELWLLNAEMEWFSLERFFGLQAVHPAMGPHFNHFYASLYDFRC